jgi:RimJ/RimL family protein N-acetyltransferase
VRLRPATREDAALLLRWRNEPATVTSTRDQKKVTAKEHAVWLEERLRPFGPEELLVAELGGFPVGLLRVAPDGTVGITVDLDYRGCGIGLHMLRALQDRERKSLRAYVRWENMASRRLFEKAGFLPTAVIMNWRP